MRSSEGELGALSKPVVELPGLGFGFDVAGELDDDAGLRVVDDDVDGEEAVEGVFALRGDVDRALRGRPAGRGFDFDRADLGGIGAVRRAGSVGPRASYRSAAREQASRPLAEEGLTLSPAGRVTTAFLQRRGAEGFDAFGLGHLEVDFEAGGGVGAIGLGVAVIVGSKRLELVAAADRRGFVGLGDPIRFGEVRLPSAR